MGDSYRPQPGRRAEPEPYRRRDYYDEDDYQNSRHRHASRDRRRARSRSPPRRLDYDGDGRTDDGGANWSDRRNKELVSRDFNRSDYLGFVNQRGQAPAAFEEPEARPAEMFTRNDRPRDMMHGPPATNAPPCGQTDHGPDHRNLKFILVRGIKQSATEQLFAKGMEKLYEGNDDVIGGATPMSIKRVLLIRDRYTDQSMGFGFVEYHHQDDAWAAVEKSRNKDVKAKLTIASEHVIICYPHTGVFPRDDADLQPESIERFKFEFRPGQMHKYHDRRAYASVLMVNDASPHDKSGKGQGGKASGKKPPKKPSAETLDSKPKKRKAPGVSAPAMLNQWTNKQAELRGEEEDVGAKADAMDLPATGVNSIPAVSAGTKSVVQTFAHEGDNKGNKIACYLCSSQFKQKEGIMKHLQESEMHAKYMQDEKMKERAYERLKNKEIDPNSTINFPAPADPMEGVQEGSTGEYRDRAKERRKEAAQTGIDKPQGFSLSGFGRKKSSTGTAPSSESDTEKTASTGKAKKAADFGLNMLMKQGWTKGSGLGGSSGEGITAPIQQDAFARGAGIGVEGANRGDAMKEADRMTKGDVGGYQEHGKELASKRYRELQK